MSPTPIVLADALIPGVLIIWLLVGLIAGFLASLVLRGSRYGILGNIVIGIIGAFIGGFLASLLGLGSF